MSWFTGRDERLRRLKPTNASTCRSQRPLLFRLFFKDRRPFDEERPQEQKATVAPVLRAGRSALQTRRGRQAICRGTGPQLLSYPAGIARQASRPKEKNDKMGELGIRIYKYVQVDVSVT